VRDPRRDDACEISEEKSRVGARGCPGLPKRPDEHLEMLWTVRRRSGEYPKILGERPKVLVGGFSIVAWRTEALLAQ
jgi:hypothetical protein